MPRVFNSLMMIWVTTCYQGFANTTDRLDQIDASVSDTFRSDSTILIPGRSKTQILEIPERPDLSGIELRTGSWGVKNDPSLAGA